MKISAKIQIDSVFVDTRNQILTTSFNLTMFWFDQRVLFKNLKEDFRLNTFEKNDVLWSPTVSFSNSITDEKTVSDTHTLMYVIKKEQGRKKDWRVPEEGKVHHNA